MYRLFVMVILFISIVPQGFARTHLCQDSGAGQYSAQFQKNLAAAKDIESKIDESPFVYACKEPNSLAGRPRTGLLKRSLPALDSEGHQSIDFLEKVFQKVNERVTANEVLVENIQACLNKKAAVGCDEVNQWADHDLPELVKTARHELAVSQQVSQYFVSDSMDTFLGKPRKDRYNHTDKEVNSELKVVGSFKKYPWEPLTHSEKLKAISTLNEAKAENHKVAMQLSRQENLPPGKASELKDQWLFGQRMKHGENYKAIMAQVPFLQYMTKANPKRGEISFAAHQMGRALVKERDLMKRLGLALQSARKSGKLDPELLDIMSYRNEVEETLLENPESCKLGASLQFTKENREIGNNLAVMLPVMAASLVVSPVIAVGLGVAAGTGMFVVENDHFEKVQARELSQVNAGALPGVNQSGMNELNEADSNRVIVAATTPLGTGATGKLARFLKLKPTSKFESALEKTEKLKTSSLPGK